jgi:3-isopropylmalate/(R)-2-methylmalate dehydratase small subunit
VERFTTLRGRAAPLLLRDVDTDVIIPMARIVGGDDFGRFAFEPLRYGADGSENPEFVLNQPAHRDASILLAGDNFGCGSSREPAVWAIRALGFRCIVAPSFGDIFFKNCFQSSVLPIVLEWETVKSMAGEVHAGEFVVDLETQQIHTPGGREIPFDVHPYHRDALLQGRDEIEMTLQREPQIRAFQESDRERRPWAYFLVR